jgi:hypothetical protein
LVLTSVYFEVGGAAQCLQHCFLLQNEWPKSRSDFAMDVTVRRGPRFSTYFPHIFLSCSFSGKLFA